MKSRTVDCCRAAGSETSLCPPGSDITETVLTRLGHTSCKAFNAIERPQKCQECQGKCLCSKWMTLTQAPQQKSSACGGRCAGRDLQAEGSQASSSTVSQMQPKQRSLSRAADAVDSADCDRLVEMTVVSVCGRSMQAISHGPRLWPGRHEHVLTR